MNILRLKTLVTRAWLLAGADYRDPPTSPSRATAESPAKYAAAAVDVDVKVSKVKTVFFAPNLLAYL